MNNCIFHRFRSYLIILTLIWGCHYTYGQNLGGGIIVGMNASQIDGDAFRGFNKAGVSLGGFVTYKLKDGLRLQPEILFEQLGSVVGPSITFAKMNMFSVPVLLNFNLPVTFDNENTQNIEVHVGPVIGFLLSARNDRDQEIGGINSTDLRATAGIAYRFNRLSLAIRYGYSISSFIQTNNLSIPLGSGRNGFYHHYVNMGFRYNIF